MTQTDLSHALLTSDFYSFQDLLTPDENAHVMEIREFLERELRPDRRRLLGPRRVPACTSSPRSAGSACSGRCGRRPSGSRTARCTAAGSRSSSRGSTPAFATFVGVQNGLTMGAIGVGGSPEQRARVAPADGDAAR